MVVNFSILHFLSINDLGVERSTEYAMKQLFTVIDSRYRSKKEIEIMCWAMEDMRNQTLKEGAINSAKRMLADGILTLEKIAEYAGLPLDEVKKLKADRTA